MLDNKPRYLITSADEGTWVFDQPVLFLGSWCLLSDREHIWSKLDYKIIPYHWDDPRVMSKDAEFVRSLYNNLLKTLSKNLNKEHGLNWSVRAWRIVIGPFVLRYIEVLFDRWKSIQTALNSFNITGASIDFAEWSENICKDFDEFSDICKTDYWNYYIYSELLSTSKKVKLNRVIPSINSSIDEIEEINEKIETEPIEKTLLKNSIRNNLFGVAKILFNSRLYHSLSSFLSRKNKYYLYDTYIGGKLNIMKLSIMLGDFPALNREHLGPDLSGIKSSKRECLEFGATANEDFEHFAKFFLPKLMPLIYIEGFKDLLTSVNEANFPKNIKKIITTIGIWKDEVFKVWTAQEVQKGTTLIVGQHGGEYGTCLFSFFEEHEQEISDTYLTWGWGNNLPQVKSAPAPTIINRKKSNWKVDGRISIICSVTPRYLSQMHPNLMYGTKSDNYLLKIESLLKLLKSNVKDLLTVKLWPSDNDRGNPLGIKLKKSFPEIHYLPLKSSLEGILSNSRLSIHTYDGTTFLETIGSGRPCMIIFSPEFHPLRKSAQPFFRILEKVGIYHKSPESASEKIIEIYRNVNNWWDSNDVLEARNIFCNEFVLTVDDPLKSYKNVILDSE